MTEREFFQYVETIRETDDYRKLMRFIGLTEYDDASAETLRDFLSTFHSRTDTTKLFVPNYDHFVRFFEAYKKKQCTITHVPQTGEIDLRDEPDSTPFIKQWGSRTGKFGAFTECYIMLPDETIFLCKRPLILDPKYSTSNDIDTNTIYNSVIATGIAKQLGISTSENFIATINNNENRLLSKFFLKPGEELITFYEDNPFNFGLKRREPKSIQEVFDSLDSALSSRRYPKNQISATKFEFLKQEFLAKLIGLYDQSANNTCIIISTDENGERSVKMAPMFDYDFSFLIAKKREFKLVRRFADNGQVDIGSLIKQYKNYPGFLEFCIRSVNNLDMNEVYTTIFRNTKLDFFSQPQNNTKLKEFTDFINNNIELAKRAIFELGQNPKPLYDKKGLDDKEEH